MPRSSAAGASETSPARGVSASRPNASPALHFAIENSSRSRNQDIRPSSHSTVLGTLGGKHMTWWPKMCTTQAESSLEYWLAWTGEPAQLVSQLSKNTYKSLLANKLHAGVICQKPWLGFVPGVDGNTHSQSCHSYVVWHPARETLYDDRRPRRRAQREPTPPCQHGSCYGGR